MADANLPDSDREDLPTEQQRPTLWSRAKSVVFKNFLPICLVFFVVLGVIAPQAGVFFSKLPTQYVCVVGILFHSGLKLKTEEVKDAFKSFKALLWEIICSLLITPIIGGQLTGLLPYQPYTACLVCHHYTSTLPSPQTKETCSEVGYDTG